MKILIITYSREVNPGTFLQAYGVQYAFCQLYPKAKIDLIKHKRLYSIVAEKKNVENKLSFIIAKIRAIPRRLKYEFEYRTKFHLTEQEFDFFNYDDNEFKVFAESYDLIVVGSDTILINLERQGHYGLMWLTNIKTNKILFAASAAPVKFELTERQINDLKASFSSYNLLGVRDEVTRKLISERIGLGDKVYCQYDPTYLIPERTFSLPYLIRKRLERVHNKQKIALVNFAVVGCPFKKELTKFLHNQGYYIISTLYNEYADSNLMTFSPFEWAAMFRYIDMAVTERFHDTVFSLRNCKPVIAIDWNEKRFSKDGFSKTQNILSQYGLVKNHFIVKDKDSINGVFDYIKNTSMERQVYQIEQHNLEISKEYEMLMKRIKETLAIVG